MTALHASNQFNVEATLNAWLAAALATYDRPAWLATFPKIVYTFPITTVSLPCWSFWHIPVSKRDLYQGRQVGGGDKGKRARGMMDVSCWTTQRNPQYLAQLRTMADMVNSAAVVDARVVIKNYMANQTSPANTAYTVTIGSVEETAPQQDSANEDIWRLRLLIDYSYIMRG